MAKFLFYFALSFVRADLNLKEILSKHQRMDDVFDEILVRKNTPHILLSDTKDILAALKKDFSEIVEIKSIGTTWENRSIDMIVIDAKSAGKTKLS